MIKSELNSRLRQYVQKHISIDKENREFISDIYNSFQKLLGENQTLQIGSYPRFTAIKPLHDLDILYVVGRWDENNHSPIDLLQEVEKKIKKEYVNFTQYNHHILLQTHSVTIIFNKGEQEIFSVDIVPAYIYSNNSFSQNTYKVPEIAKHRHTKRKQIYTQLQEDGGSMGWIHTDPRGYIETAKQINEINNDFRKTVKLLKSWKGLHKAETDNFKLKSFHIEQVITGYYQENKELEIFDAIFRFFVEIPSIISKPVIKDRASHHKFIDAYLDDLSSHEKELIIQARDCYLKKMEDIETSDTVRKLFLPCFYERSGPAEKFLFDFNIPVLTDDRYAFRIYGEVQERKGGFRKFILDLRGLINVDRNIKFGIRKAPNVDMFKWKVKNDRKSKEPRGEITDHQTLRGTEHTKYKGNHYVECYAILNNVCVAKSRQYVRLN